MGLLLLIDRKLYTNHQELFRCCYCDAGTYHLIEFVIITAKSREDH